MTRPLPNPNTYWVLGSDDHLLAGSYPGGRDPGDDAPGALAANLRAYLDAGVDVFIDLTKPFELVPYERELLAQAQAAGVAVTYRRMSIYDVSVPTRDSMAGILNTIDKAIAAGHTVYVHCWGGVGRTGTVVGCWLVRHGMEGRAALVRVQELFAASGLSNDHHRLSPETERQREFVRRWKEG
jgi:hypothetical protein